MAESGNRRAWEWGSIIATVVLVAAALIYYQYLYEPTPRAERHDVAASTFPERFPPNIPVDASGGITQNFTASAPGVPFQATREFTTRKTLDENVTLYRAFFATDGWQVKNVTVSSQYVTLLAANPVQHIQASLLMSEGPGTNERTINIAITGLRAGIEQSSTTPTP